MERMKTQSWILPTQWGRYKEAVRYIGHRIVQQLFPFWIPRIKPCHFWIEFLETRGNSFIWPDFDSSWIHSFVLTFGKSPPHRHKATKAFKKSVYNCESFFSFKLFSCQANDTKNRYFESHMAVEKTYLFLSWYCCYSCNRLVMSRRTKPTILASEISFQSCF